MARGMAVGCTDYSHQSLKDMIVDLKDWTQALEETISCFEQLEATASWSTIPHAFRALAAYSKKLFLTAKDELTYIIQGMEANQISMDMPKRVRRLGTTALELNRDYGQVWNQRGIYDELEQIETAVQLYKEGRLMAGDMEDLTNLASRLDDFVNVNSSTTNIGNFNGVWNNGVIEGDIDISIEDEKKQ